MIAPGPILFEQDHINYSHTVNRTKAKAKSSALRSFPGSTPEQCHDPVESLPCGFLQRERECVFPASMQKLPGPGTRATIGPTMPWTVQQEQGILKLRLIPSIALPSSYRLNCIVYSYSGKTSCWLNLPSGLRPRCFNIGDWKRVGAHSLHLSWKVYRSQQQFLGHTVMTSSPSWLSSHPLLIDQEFRPGYDSINKPDSV